MVEVLSLRQGTPLLGEFDFPGTFHRNQRSLRFVAKPQKHKPLKISPSSNAGSEYTIRFATTRVAMVVK